MPMWVKNGENKMDKDCIASVGIKFGAPAGELGRIFTVYVHEGGDGAVRCGVGFNPSADSDVDVLKALSAALMDHIASLKENNEDDHDGIRCYETAQDYLEAAQMFAVKGLFCGKNRKK